MALSVCSITVSLLMLPVLLSLLLSDNHSACAAATKEEQEHQHRRRPRLMQPWLVKDYPHPDKEENPALSSSSSSTLCRSRTKRFCDPDGIIQGAADLERLDDALSVVVRSPYVCPDSTAKKENDENPEKEKENGGVEVQFAVAFVDKMDLTPFQENYVHGGHQHPDIESLAAETFGMSIHNDWGVGLDHLAQCGGRGGGTGVLIFISRLDRAVYISRGGALENVLTNERLQHNVIDQTMKPLLRQGQFVETSVQAIHAMTYYLQTAGPPSFWERHGSSVMVFSLISVFVSIVAYGEYKDRQDRKRYSQVTRHLNEIDQARAEALQGRFQCRSCPICLEPFPVPPSPPPTTTTLPLVAPPNPAATSAFDRDIIDVKGIDETSNGSNKNDNKNTEEQPRLGSDGKPITLLRCGHVFDQTCWLEWVHSGRGQVDKCPICKEHVDGSGGGIGNSFQSDRQSLVAPTRNTNVERLLLRRRNDSTGSHHQNERNINNSTINRDQRTSNPAPEGNCGNNNDNSRDDSNGYFTRQDSFQTRQRQRHQLPHDRILAMYMMERNFRLAQLGHHYPQFVGPEQIQQWTRNDIYNNGQQPLARDPAFVRVDPRVRAAAAAAEAAERARNQSSSGGGRSSSSSGFGGGRSGGGVGGRW